MTAFAALIGMLFVLFVVPSGMASAAGTGITTAQAAADHGQSFASRLTIGPGSYQSMPPIRVQTQTGHYDMPAISSCPAWIWVVAINRATTTPEASTVGNPCTGTVGAVINSLVSNYPNDVFVVNNGYIPNSASGIADRNLAQELAILGFGPITADGTALGSVDLARSVFSGVGGVGLTLGAAWEATDNNWLDEALTAGNGVAPSVVSVRGQLVSEGSTEGPSGFFHLVNFEAKVAQRYGGDGAGGWRVDGVSYPSGSYPGLGGGAVPPTHRGGFQVVVVTTAADTLQVNNLMFWTNTSDSDANDVAWTALAKELIDDSRSGRHMILMRNVGSAKGAVSTSGGDKALLVARALQRLGGLYDAVVQTSLENHLNVVIPGGLPLDVPQAQRTTMPFTIGSVVSTSASRFDPRFVSVLLTRVHNGFAFQPARAATGVSDTDDPFAYQKALGAPDLSWPTMDQAHALAYAGWSSLLCGCTDARSKLLDGQYGSWSTLLAQQPSATWDRGLAAASTTSSLMPLAAWTDMRSELLAEQGWAVNVWGLYAHEQQVLDDVSSTTSGELATVVGSVKASLATNAAIDIKSDTSHRIFNAVIEGTLVGLSDMPKVSNYVTVALAAWVGALEYEDKREAPYTTFSGTISELPGVLYTEVSNLEQGLAVQTLRVLSDYGRLKAVGSALANATPGSPWYLDPAASGTEAKALVSTTEVGLYRAIVPAIYDEIETRNAPSADILKDWGHHETQAFTGTKDDYTFVNFKDTPGSRLSTVGDAAGRSYLAAIGRSPLFTDVDTHPRQLSQGVMDQLQADGVWLPVVFRQWPFAVTSQDSTHSFSVSDPYNPTISGTCFTWPAYCFFGH
jgi:hypothetical protein